MSSKRVNEFAKIIPNNDILDYLKTEKISRPTQVQKECIPEILKGNSLSVQGMTGSGKTLGFLLPLFKMLKDSEEGMKSDKASPKALIVLPTRELALQVFSIAKALSHFSKLRIRKIVGGDKGKSLSSVFASEIDILITTPDRCLRSFQNKELKKKDLKFLILDEADQLLEPSFQKTMTELSVLLDHKDLQIVLVSASRPPAFGEIIKGFFPSKLFLIVGRGEENKLGHNIKSFNINLEEATKSYLAKKFIKENGKSNGLIFLGNKDRAKKLFQQLQEEKVHPKLFLLHKDLDIKERVQVVNKFRESGGVLIATDVFARGIDVPHLTWVLNFDIPSAPDYYLHRSGRVGRAGRSGFVYNFITSKDGKRLSRINLALSSQGRHDLKIKNNKR